MHNKTAELSEWDFDMLQIEIDDLDLDDFDLDDFDYDNHQIESFNKAMENNPLEEDEQYKKFEEKFKPKKTTDDCYTPPSVYDVVADYVKDKYNVNRKNFVRPFYPGGDYKQFKYGRNNVVVDNPPFSIFSEIIKFYTENNIKFFMFAPSLTMFKSTKNRCSCIVCGVSIIYENGANVSTSFVTNLEDCSFRSEPILYKSIKECQQEQGQMPKYVYPSNVITSTMLAQFSKYGIDFVVNKCEAYFIKKLSSQFGDVDVFGGGYIISNKKSEEKQKKA